MGEKQCHGVKGNFLAGSLHGGEQGKIVQLVGTYEISHLCYGDATQIFLRI